MHFDWTVSIGNVLTVIGALVFAGRFGLKHFRSMDRLMFTIEHLTETVEELRLEIKSTTEQLHTVDKRVSLLERIPKIMRQH